MLASSCQKSEFLTDGDFFHLSNDGAKMDVWVKGNFNSDVMLITVHGGPGETGMGFSVAPGFQSLEDDYMLVYWDQRFSGMSQGHPDISTMNPEQIIEDAGKLVELLQYKYPEKVLFMLGHSWGGQVTAGYIGREDHQSNIKGWIDVDGSVYAELESQLMKEWILERVPAKLAEPNADVEFWQFIIDWYEENPNPGNYTGYEPYWYVGALEGDAYDWPKFEEEHPLPYTDLIFNSMFSMSHYVYAFGEQKDIEAWDDLDLTPEVENITIPVLLIWGANDGIVPPAVGDYVYEHLGTPESMKRLVKIDNCGHGPQNDQHEIFYQEVKDFIETYK